MEREKKKRVIYGVILSIMGLIVSIGSGIRVGSNIMEDIKDGIKGDKVESVESRDRRRYREGVSMDEIVELGKDIKEECGYD